MRAYLCIRTALAICAAAPVLHSCERRPLEEPDFGTGVRVMVNINAIANVTADIYNENIPLPDISPEVMHVLFFEKNADRLVTEAYLRDKSVGEDGQTTFRGNISISPGSYRMLIYNFGTETVAVRESHSWEAALAYTDPVPDRIAGSFQTKTSPGEKVLLQPDHLVVARSDDETIPYHSGTYTVRAESRSIVESYYVQIKVEGLEYVSGAQAILSGVCGGNILSSNTRITDPPASVYFRMHKSHDRGVPVICTVFNTFGRIEDYRNELEVTFDLRTVDGRTVNRTFDISGLFLTEACIRHRWLLLEETIHIDPPKSDGGGFDPSVGDWEDERHDIII